MHTEPAALYRAKAWVDFGLMLLTFLSTLLWSVEVGIVVSVTVSVGTFPRNLGAQLTVRVYLSFYL